MLRFALIAASAFLVAAQTPEAPDLDLVNEKIDNVVPILNIYLKEIIVNLDKDPWKYPAGTTPFPIVVETDIVNALVQFAISEFTGLKTAKISQFDLSSIAANEDAATYTSDFSMTVQFGKLMGYAEGDMFIGVTEAPADGAGAIGLTGKMSPTGLQGALQGKLEYTYSDDNVCISKINIVDFVPDFTAIEDIEITTDPGNFMSGIIQPQIDEALPTIGPMIKESDLAGQIGEMSSAVISEFFMELLKEPFCTDAKDPTLPTGGGDDSDLAGSARTDIVYSLVAFLSVLALVFSKNY